MYMSFLTFVKRVGRTMSYEMKHIVNRCPVILKQTNKKGSENNDSEEGPHIKKKRKKYCK